MGRWRHGSAARWTRARSRCRCADVRRSFAGADARRQRPHAVGAAERGGAALIGRTGRPDAARRARRARPSASMRVGGLGQRVPALEPQLHERVRRRVGRRRPAPAARRDATHTSSGRGSRASPSAESSRNRTRARRCCICVRRRIVLGARHRLSNCAVRTSSPPLDRLQPSRWASSLTAQAPRARHNRVIALLEQKQPVFGLYAPSNRRGGPPGARPAATPDAPAKSPAELAREAAAYKPERLRVRRLDGRRLRRRRSRPSSTSPRG